MGSPRPSAGSLRHVRGCDAHPSGAGRSRLLAPQLFVDQSGLGAPAKGPTFPRHRGESAVVMCVENKAVFLSYASQDADAARRICEALRAAGVEVWFDQSELRGGDAWDAKIRKQIVTCDLFIPVISTTTQA